MKSERDLLVAGIITGWQLEADEIYYIGLADLTTGACPAGRQRRVDVGVDLGKDLH